MVGSGSKLPNPQLHFGISTSSSSGSSSSHAPFNFSTFITTKLGTDNYLYWRAQVAPILRSHLLTGFVHGTFPCPPEYVDNPKAKDDTTAAPCLYNLEFTAWHR
jgi:hypothetical protein